PTTNCAACPRTPASGSCSIDQPLPGVCKPRCGICSCPRRPHKNSLVDGRSFQQLRPIADHVCTRAAVLVCTALVATVSLTGPAQARGVSPYVPLNVSPEIEREISRALLLAGYPVVRRPIAAATLLDALVDVCKFDVVLCG